MALTIACMTAACDGMRAPHGRAKRMFAMDDGSLATIRDLCGAKSSQRLGDFRKLLRTALDLLVTKETSIAGWLIDKNDCVVVTRRPSKSQQRYLDR